MIEEPFVSADAHVVEPADLWTTRMDKRFRDRAPRIESRERGDFYIIEGLTPFAVGLEGASIEDKIKGRIESPEGHRHSATRTGAWDPEARLVDQDLDNICAEMIYPGIFGIQFSRLRDADYQRECVQVYNNWLSEFCRAAPDRLLGAALLPMNASIDSVLREAERVAKQGLRELLIPITTNEPYSSPKFAPLWSALQDLGLPVGVHTGTGVGEDIMASYERLGVGEGATYFKMVEPMRWLINMIWSGIPQSYPKLRFVIVEGGIGWIASVLRFMDHWWEDHHLWVEPRLDEPPSFYFKRQFWATFEDDRAGLLTRELLGVDRLMWGSDYPHTEGTFPRSREQIAKDFSGIPDAEVSKMVRENAAQLYGLA